MSAIDATISSESIKTESGTLVAGNIAAVSDVDDNLFKKPLPVEEVINKISFVSPGYEVKYKLEGHQSPVTALKFCRQGNYLASGSNDRMLKLWNVATGQLETTLDEGHKLGINDVTWSPDNSFMASCSDDKTIKLWSPHSGHCIRTLVGHSDWVFACSVHPHSNLIATASFDCTVRLWDVRNGRALKAVHAHNDPISSVDFHPNGKFFVTGSFDGLVRIWDMISGKVLKTLIDADNSPVGCVKFAPNGRYILTAHLNSQIKLWKFKIPKCLRIYEGHTNLKYCIPVKFSVTAGMWIVSGSEDNFLHIWSLQSKELVQKIPAHSKTIVCLDCHPKENLIATGSLDSSENLRIWQSGEVVIDLNK